MTTTVSATPTTIPAARRRRTPARKVALAGGIAYLVTFAASIPQLGLFADLVDDPAGYVTAPRDNSAVLWGSWLEIVTAAAGVATAVALYPVLRRFSRTSAIGFVTSRVVEAALILVGVVSVLAVVSLQQDHPGTEGLAVTGAALVAVRQATFLVGPGIVPAFNALFLATALFRFRLVPRVIPAIGLVGAPLLLISATSTMFGGWEQVSGTALLFALPIAVWEFSLGVWLTVKGFRREVDV
jgi:Domain of unknown function (DUF4386)